MINRLRCPRLHGHAANMTFNRENYLLSVVEGKQMS